MDKIVLAAVLDWGLGHATRMVPVIDALQRAGIKVLIGSSGPSLAYLSARYPDITALEMPSKQVNYSKQGAGMALAKRVIQQPRLNKIQENWTAQAIKRHGVTGIISDNVYGTVSEMIPSIVVTHQAGLLAPFFKSVFDRKLAAWLNRFTEVWIPDLPGPDSLAGKMAENAFLSATTRHIGRLSRLQPMPNVACDLDVLALISGPEPQRSAMEKLALEYFKIRKGKKLLIRGVSGLPVLDVSENDAEIRDFLDGQELSSAIQRAETVICRSGFSTLCDLMALGARAKLIPTPQQPEQIYLANRCREKGWFGLVKDEAYSENKLQSHPPNQTNLLRDAVDNFISLI